MTVRFASENSIEKVREYLVESDTRGCNESVESGENDFGRCNTNDSMNELINSAFRPVSDSIGASQFSRPENLGRSDSPQVMKRIIHSDSRSQSPDASQSNSSPRGPKSPKAVAEMAAIKSNAYNGDNVGGGVCRTSSSKTMEQHECSDDGSDIESLDMILPLGANIGDMCLMKYGLSHPPMTPCERQPWERNRAKGLPSSRNAKVASRVVGGEVLDDADNSGKEFWASLMCGCSCQRSGGSRPMYNRM